MAKQSNSLRTMSLMTQATSFFDSSTTDVKFWKQKYADEEDFSQYPVLIENEFYFHKKTFFKEWSSGTLSIRGSFLFFKQKRKSKDIHYVNLDEGMYRVEIIGPTHKKYHHKYPHGFTLYSNGNSFDFYCKDQAQFANWITYFKKLCIMTDFYENYKIMDVLGTGGYGKVYRLESLKTGTRFAGKFIKLNGSVAKDRQKVMITNEIRMLRKIDHPLIVKLYEVYELPGQICLVMELVEGEKFFNFLTSQRYLSEQKTAYIMKQLFIMLCHLETQDIIHRDLKLENILCNIDASGKVHIKLIDFGLATFHKKRDLIKKCGTPGYVAPEILNCDPYNFKADLYSAGVIMHICLTGRPVFYAKDYEELLHKNRRGVIRFKGSHWMQLSPEVQDLIQRMLEPLPSFRISLLDAISHEWLMSNISPEDRKDLSEYMFKISRLNIPQEENISRVPRTHGQLPSVRKTGTHSLQDSGLNKIISNSFYTSNLAAGEEVRELNSFYRRNSRDISTSSQTVSRSSLSAFSNQENGMVIIIPKGNTLAPPVMQIGSPRGLNNRGGSLKSATKLSLSCLSTNMGYKIQVSGVIDSWHDLEVGHEEDGKLCSEKYDHLKQTSINNLKRIYMRKKKHSLTEIKVTMYNNPQTATLETCPETPRIKYRVAPIDQGTRNYICTEGE